MPDPDRRSVSASQAGALFGRHPYLTPWMLYQDMTGLAPIEEHENERMDLGKRFEPIILDLVAERLRLEVRHNKEQRYVRNGEIGCTLDAEITCPARGEGIIQAKMVDRMIWLSGWTETTAPPWIEIQLQTELAATNAQWGAIAALVGGNDLRIYERHRDPHLITQICNEASTFMVRVKDRDPPPMEGMTIELPQLDRIYADEEPGEPADLRKDRGASEIISEFKYWSQQQRFAKLNHDRLRPKVLAIAAEAEAQEIRTHGALTRVKRSRQNRTLPRLPKELCDRIIAYLATPKRDPNVVALLSDCLLWNANGHEPGNITTRISIKPQDDGTPDWPTDWSLGPEDMI